MQAFLKKQWLFLAPLILAAASYLTPSVQAWAAAHPAYGALALLLWGKLLHRAEPPQSLPGSKF